MAPKATKNNKTEPVQTPEEMQEENTMGDIFTILCGDTECVIGDSISYAWPEVY